ncbi:signal peptide-containing protein [Theileria equi strain WA]|uniref:Signal peptide-containing protein n=1 Tax=Theileria equi strain WA TaxID=1537102 RepID=L0AZ93_THEEQ|nr:signal peptide-containing protein [Theileria equi strain WA]AFZ80887.1 signal peptide-containing protein [Theileria equi strain WA]|eukprot:XP_004830553.1 signal peptide-containing protein [Theileria equi strain WA]
MKATFILVIRFVLVLLTAIPRHFVLTLVTKCNTKIPVDLDLSGPLPDKIIISPSKEFLGTLYQIKPEYRKEYRIGRITDNSELISDDHFRNSKRMILVRVYPDSTVYIEVNTAFRNSKGELGYEWDEFFRTSIHTRYHPVERTPIELEIMMEGSTSFIKVVENPSTNTRHYLIQDDKDYAVKIGVIKFGKYVIDDRVDEVFSKFVTFNGSADDPHVFVTSIFKDKSCIKSKYNFVGGPRPFVLEREFAFHDL